MTLKLVEDALKLELKINGLLLNWRRASQHCALMDTEVLSSIANIFWQTCIDEGVTPKEFKERGMVPRPDSIKTR